ncbi:MAG: hypothetical protein ACRD2L_12690, partial [Terriglobia bacterium]
FVARLQVGHGDWLDRDVDSWRIRLLLENIPSGCDMLPVWVTNAHRRHITMKKNLRGLQVCGTARDHVVATGNMMSAQVALITGNSE